MRKHGITLIGVLSLIGLLGTLAFITATVLGSVRARLDGQKLQQQSAAMAVSGRDYAAAMIASGRWHGPHRFQSPLFEGGQSFEVEVRPVGAKYKVISLGHVGPHETRLEATP